MIRTIQMFALFAWFGGASTAAAVTLDDLHELLSEGIGEDVILDQVEADREDIRLETEDIVALKRAGASDALLRELIRLGDPRSVERQSLQRSQARSSGDRLSQQERSGPEASNWTSDYSLPERSSGLRIEVGFDPFGYHWLANPYYYSYYYPFPSVDFGFYHAGWVHRSWWGWSGHRASYYRRHCDTAYWRHHNHHYYAHHDAHGTSRYKSGRDTRRRGRARVEQTDKRGQSSRLNRTRSQRPTRNPARLRGDNRRPRDRSDRVQRDRRESTRAPSVGSRRPRAERPRTQSRRQASPTRKSSPNATSRSQGRSGRSRAR